jgi:hypothetical protein
MVMLNENEKEICDMAFSSWSRDLREDLEMIERKSKYDFGVVDYVALLQKIELVKVVVAFLNKNGITRGGFIVDISIHLEELKKMRKKRLPDIQLQMVEWSKEEKEKMFDHLRSKIPLPHLKAFLK